MFFSKPRFNLPGKTTYYMYQRQVRRIILGNDVLSQVLLGLTII